MGKLPYEEPTLELREQIKDITEGRPVVVSELED